MTDSLATNPTAVLIAGCLCLTASTTAAMPVLVDSFQTPQQSSLPHSMVSAPEALGGTRLLATDNSGGANVAGGTLAYDQPSQYGWPHYCTLGYDANGAGLGPVDLTFGSSMDRLEITVDSSTMAGQFTVDLSCAPLSRYSSERTILVEATASPAVYTFPFSQFEQGKGAIGPATLTSIHSITVRFLTDRYADPGQLVLSRIQIAPEPASLALFAGLAMVLTLRQKNGVRMILPRL